MDITNKIMDYHNNSINKKDNSSCFLDLADEIIRNFDYRLKDKTYLLIQDPSQELREMAYEYNLYKRKPMPISLTSNMFYIMKKFNEVAQKLGFTVITKLSEYNNDGPLFDLLGSESVESELIEYEKKLDFNKVNLPLTLSIDDYLESPFLPAVFKNITANRGEDKYLIENKEQLKKILTLFNLPESKKINLKNEFVVQEYIKSFEGINSSIRVMTTCTGDILSSLFLISMDEKHKNKTKQFGIDIFNPCEYLNDPNSQYYLNSKNIISNAAAGGRVIPLNPQINNLTLDDKILLTLHEINTETLELPTEIVEQCKNIAPFWDSKKGIVLGIDFIYNSSDDKWYYLETNRDPSIEGYKRFMNLNGYFKKDIKSLMHLDSLTKIVQHIITKDKTLKTR